ncbi:MAG: hypothetical protein F6K24_09395 [Okeania sp. SIO2D1]|nr:hypothetical protein [Okeania sp. SIO2D1]
MLKTPLGNDRSQESGEMGIVEEIVGMNYHLIFLPLPTQNANSLSFLDISNFLFTE